MHLLARDARSLDEAVPAADLGHAPADLLVLSFSDADLACLAAAHAPGGPSLRLVALARLRHPLSVDLYLEQTASHACCIVLRLLGGLDYWRYGTEELAALCRARRIPLAILPGDNREDPALAALSTLPAPAYARLLDGFRHGGRANMARVLALMASQAELAPDDGLAPEPVPQHGVLALDLDARPLAAIVLYRSHMLAEDTAPLLALADALRARGLAAGLLYAASLKSPDSAGWIARTLAAWRPTVVLNATGFSARLGDAPSPLEAPGVPVLQLVLAGTTRSAWAASSRGLTPADLAMQVVLPELDGRLLTTAISFKQERDGLARHTPEPAGIALAADRAAAWSRLGRLAPVQRRVAIVLSDYPGATGRRGHAVGLDGFASLAAITAMLREAGYECRATSAEAATEALCRAAPAAILSLAAYRARFAALPAALQAAALAAWGDPASDPALHDGQFTAARLCLGRVSAFVQPPRSHGADHRAAYHDATLPPCHAFIAFHFALQDGADALVHLGAHGSLEWLPGKATALSPACWPAALAGSLPVLYPFIVNNPGEAAAAKRRLGAVTIGHLTPPLRPATHHGEAARLETLIDEYAAADGLDRPRTALLRTEILDRAAACGLLDESGALPGTSDDDALARLDAHLCDVKELQIRDGLHIFATQPPPDRLAHLPAGAAACAAAERAGLLAGLSARFVAPGPAGAPSAARIDVLPTGRNLSGVDPRMLPTRAALTLATRTAADLLHRHRADHGDWPRALVLNVWGAATMRTGGHDIALALHLLGVRPVWDAATARVHGFEVTPIAELNHPRVDVTLRISGLFRDAFAGLVTLFDAAAQAVASRDEAPDWNPLAAQPGPRVFGPAPGAYGAGPDWLAASATAYGTGEGAAPGILAARVQAADAFLHVQDHAGTDLLDGPEHAAHLGGFAAAARALGAEPALWHHDGQTRPLAGQIARVVRGRAANPAWIAGMMRHAYAGAAEIAGTVDALASYAETLPDRLDRQFDLLYAALATPAVDAFLRRENPQAHAFIAARFRGVREAGLWHPRSNAAAA